MSDPVTVEIADGVAVVSVDNPPVNALGAAVLTGLLEAARSLAADDRVRAVLIVGTGPIAFLAGADIRELDRMLGDRDAMDAHVALSGEVYAAWSGLPQPAIAVAQASALGGGLELALCCDLIVADPAARFGLPEVRLGLIPGAGGTQRLPRRIAPALARRMILTGSSLDAEEARRAGLVDYVAEADGALAEAHRHAGRFAAGSAAALRAAKRAARGAIEGAPLEAGLGLETELFLTLTGSDDAREGVRAFIEKRPASFPGAPAAPGL